MHATATLNSVATTDNQCSATSTDTELVEAARQGSSRAWVFLVERHKGLVWHVIRTFRLSNAAAEDVSQTVWLKAVEHLDQLRDPERIGSWLATTARNAAIAEWRKGGKQVPVGAEVDQFDSPVELPDRVVEGEEHRALVRAFHTLDENDQQLLRLSVTQPDLSYEDISWMISRPVGSIGPSRARALAKMRRNFDAVMAEPVSVGA